MSIHGQNMHTHIHMGSGCLKINNLLDKSKPSITKKGCPNEVWPQDPSCRLGQYKGLAESDIADLNKLYCGDVEPPTECSNNPDYAERLCDIWKSLGFCRHSYVDWMAANCKKSCGCKDGVYDTILLYIRVYI